jgi:uncharacterized lipoprotein YmbA
MRQLVIILGLFCLTACTGSSSIPKTHAYLLRADVQVPNGEQIAPVNVGIGRVALASYLDQSGIVLQTGPDEVHAARQHIWAEPLDDAVRIYLRDAVSAGLGYPVSGDAARRQTWDYRIDVGIDQFHGSLDGDVVIDASWIIIDTATQQQLARHRFQQTAAQSDDGYEALIAAKKSLLNELAGAIAASFIEINADAG